MKRIAILGCENSHADAFLSCIRDHEKYSDVQVVGVYSNDRTAADKLSAAFGVPVLEDYTDAVGKIDGLMITARHGDNHYKYAAPYIDSSIPMFIDKPITQSEQDAADFMAQLKAKSIPVCGGSSLKHDALVAQLASEAKTSLGGKTVGGLVRAPYQSKNDYGDFYFYAQHLVEMVCEIFGRFPLSVTAKQNGGQLHVLFHYQDFDCVGLYCDNNYVYYACRMSESGANGYVIPSTSEWFAKEFEEFYKLLSNSIQPMPYEEFFAPVFIMNAIARSLEGGTEQAVRYPEVQA